MKKLGFIVEMKDCKDAADLRRWVDLAQQQGIDGVELLFNSKCGVDFSLDKIKPAFENTPVEPAACGLWWLNTISPDPDERAAVRRTMLEFLDMAEAIGCRMAFFNTGEYDPEDPDKCKRAGRMRTRAERTCKKLFFPANRIIKPFFG